MSTYDDYYGECGNCEYFEYEGDNTKGYCNYYKCYCWPDDTCKHSIDKASESWCYITTIVCNILGLPDNHPILNDLRNLRNNVLQKDDKYSELLYEYDTIGPKLAKNIQEEYNQTGNKKPWFNIYNIYLEPCASLVHEEKTYEAIILYKTMVAILMQYYGIKEDNEKIENYDYTQGGHGKVKKLAK